MDYLHYRNRVLHCEEVAVPQLADAYGTPLFIYSQRTLLHHLNQLKRAFADAKPLICYSLKTNPNLSICRLMVENGAGFDVTSGGELFRALKAGGTGDKIVFAGVGKTDRELRDGLENNVRMFNVESEAELLALADGARQVNRHAEVALRVNPALPPKTHVKTDTSVKGTQFGFDIDSVLEFAQKVVDHGHIRIVGLHMHLGSPILDTKPYREGLEKAVLLVKRLREQGHPIDTMNMGGGFGIHYPKQAALPADAFAEVIVPAVQAMACKLFLEPGRFIVGNAGILLSRVIYTKESGGSNFIIKAAATNVLDRPTRIYSF